MKLLKKFKWLLLPLLVILLFFYWQFFVPPSSQKEAVFLEVAPGEPFEQVIPRLKEKNLIRNETLYEYLAEYTNLDTKVKAGRFRVQASWSPYRILLFLTHPENGELFVTVPEGFSIFEIDEKLVKLGLIQEREFIAWTTTSGISEGKFFPDTYSVFSKNFHSKDLGEKMMKNFEKKVVKGLAQEFKRSKRSLEEIITMASLLEKEVKTKEDFPIVAGILWKRLEKDWPLQVDATLLYGRTERTITQKDLDRSTPYNTYLNQGLPPTPIGNPGLEIIKAALHPVDSPYWFYLTTKDGKVIYAKTNEEQNVNRKKYL